jgi:acyl-coenzyme A thioesterase 13
MTNPAPGGDATDRHPRETAAFATDIPDGYRPLAPMAGFMVGIGTLYQHESTHVFGIRVQTRHLNNLNVAHGGMLATIADSAIGFAMLQSAGQRKPGVTVHLSIDYLNPAHNGDWLEVHVDLDRMGQRLRVGACRLMVGDVCVMKASATFAVVTPVATHAKGFEPV